MAFTKEQIEQKTRKHNEEKTQRAVLLDKKETLIEDIKTKFSIKDGKELQLKIKELTELKKEKSDKYEEKCNQYEKLEEEVGL